jgi:predicted metalloprotease
MRLTVALVVLASTLAACGGDDGDTASTTGSTTSTTASSEGETAAGEGEKATDVVAETALPVYAGDPDATGEPDGNASLKALPTVARADDATVVPNIRGSAGATVTEWMHAVDNDIANFWQGQFNAADLKFRPAHEVIYTQPQNSPCGVRSNASGPGYCQSNETMYLPVAFFVEEANPVGDAAIAIVIAHEVGHHVQKLLYGATDTSVSKELQADCLSGVWAASIYQRGFLEQGDLREVFKITSSAGDSPGNAPSHGTADQRLDALFHGYDQGRAGNCNL